jgi:tryptophan synthase alpha chain
VSLEAALRDRIGGGGRCLVPYLTGGLPQQEPADWTTTLAAVAAAGADAIEVGIPFSDPVMDGPVIQEASEVALAAGTTPAGVLDQLERGDFGVPLAVMTYANLVYRFGWRRFASTAASAGVAAAILPDIPLEESGPWCEAADAAGVETVMLVAPTAPRERIERIVQRAHGFVYAVGLLGVTGERSELAASARDIARRCKEATDKPVLVGVGIGTPQQAVEVCEVADGVVIGSAVVRTALRTRSPEAVADLVGRFRGALDGG